MRSSVKGSTSGKRNSSVRGKCLEASSWPSEGQRRSSGTGERQDRSSGACSRDAWSDGQQGPELKPRVIEDGRFQPSKYLKWYRCDNCGTAVLYSGVRTRPWWGKWVDESWKGKFEMKDYLEKYLQGYDFRWHCYECLDTEGKASYEASVGLKIRKRVSEAWRCCKRPLSQVDDGAPPRQRSSRSNGILHPRNLRSSR